MRAVGNHWPPIPIALLVSRKMQLTGQNQNETHGMVTDRISVHAAGICQPDSSRAQLIQRKLLIARADNESFPLKKEAEK